MRRAFTVVLLLLGSVGVVVCGGGICGSLWAGGEVRDATAGAHGAVDDLLAGVQDGIRRVGPEVAALRERLKEELSEEVAARLTETLHRVGDFLTTVANTAGAVAALVDTPGTDRPRIERLREMAERLRDADLSRLRVVAGTAAAEHVLPRVRRAEQLLGNLHRGLSELRLDVSGVRNRVDTWTGWSVFALAGLFVWMALGQACLVTSQVRRLRRAPPPAGSPR